MARARSSIAERAAAGALLLVALASPARADLELCNRTSFVIEAAIGIEEKGAAATRGWFRVDPGACRTVMRGNISSERLYLHARALALYGNVRLLTAAHAELCVGEGDFLVAGARRCGASERLAPFAEMLPRQSEAGLALQVAEPADYAPETARLAAIQRLLTLAGYGAEPIDGIAGPRTDAALGLFLRERNLPPDAVNAPSFLALLMDTVRDGAGPGLLWCNDTAHAVMAALGIEEGGAVVTRGWWRVAPGACVRPELPQRPRGKVYSFAEAVDEAGAAVARGGKPLAWGGATPLCVRNSRFEIREHSDCAGRGLTRQDFALVEPAARGTTLRFREP